MGRRHHKQWVTDDQQHHNQRQGSEYRSGGGIFNYIGTEWQDITIQPVDTANNIIGGNTSTLSPFLMAIPDAVPPAWVGGVAGLVAGNETVPDESSPMDVTGVAPAMALAGVVLALIGGTTLYVRRRHVRM